MIIIIWFGAEIYVILGGIWKSISTKMQEMADGSNPDFCSLSEHM